MNQIPITSGPLAAVAAHKQNLLTDPHLPAEKKAELAAKLEAKVLLAQLLEQQKQDAAAQVEKERQHRQDLERVRKKREETLKESFKMAKDRLQMFVPGTMVEAWCSAFQETCDLFELDKDYALKLFFSRISTDSGSWITEFREDDRKKGQKVTDVDRWLKRLQRTYAQSYATQLQVVKNIRQEENEPADAFVQRFRAKAKAANRDWSQMEIVNMMQESVHPRWRQAFILFNNDSRDYAGATSALSKAMSTQMEAFRQMMANSGSASSATGTSVTAATATTSDAKKSPAQNSRSRRRSGSGSRSSQGQSNAAQSGNWSNNRNKQHNQNQKSPPGNCLHCGLPGHWKRECPSLAVSSMDPAAFQSLQNAVSQRMQSERNGSVPAIQWTNTPPSSGTSTQTTSSMPKNG
jgi:hypothetical protein